MGRSNFNSVVARAYTILPVPQVTADVAGTTDYSNNPGVLAPILGITSPEAVPGGTIRDFDVAGGTRPLAPMLGGCAVKQGFMWSLNAASGAAGAQTLAIRNSAASVMTAPVAIPAGAQSFISGLVEGSWRATGAGGAAAFGATDRVNSTNSKGLTLFVDSTDASHVVTRPALGIIYTARMFIDNTGVPIPLDRPSTYFPGAVKGFYITVPLGDANLASGQTNQIVRAITVPMDMRLHAVCFSTSVSAAGNTLKLRNTTIPSDIVPATAMISATADSIVIPASSLLAGSRDLKKGDVLTIQGTTGGTGFTAAAAMLIGHTTGHFHVTNPALDTICSVPQTVEPSFADPKRYVSRTNFSGPCRGGYAFLQLPVSVAAINQTAFAVSRVVAPFDCQIAWAGVSYRASAAGNTYALYNVTKATAITADIAGVNTGTTGVPINYADVLGNPVAKGDVLELRVTTAGTAGFAAIGGAILVHVRGHVNTSPAFD